MQISHAFSIVVVNSPSNWSHQENYEIDTAESRTVEGEIWLVKSHEFTKNSNKHKQKRRIKKIKFKVTISSVPFMIAVEGMKRCEQYMYLCMLFDHRAQIKCYFPINEPTFNGALVLYVHSISMIMLHGTKIGKYVK